MQQVCEILWRRKIVAVRVDILAKEGDLFYAAVYEQPNFFDYFGYGPANFATTAIGDDAEGAELVAAVDDRNERRDVGRRRNHVVQATLVVHAEGSPNGGHDRLELLWLCPHVDLREAALQVVFDRADHTPHHADDALGVFAFRTLELAEHARCRIFG